MRRFRFTIASLIGVVIFTAVAFAALRDATDLWDSIVFTLTACGLLASVLLAIHRAGPSRAYWLGFALVGVGYLVASLVPAVESRLATRRGLTYLAAKIAEQSQPVTLSGTLTGVPASAPTSIAFTAAPRGSGSGYAVASTSQGSIRFWNASTGKLLVNLNGSNEEFVRIGHSFVALLLAFAGGGFSRWLHGAARRREERAAQAEASAA